MNVEVEMEMEIDVERRNLNQRHANEIARVKSIHVNCFDYSQGSARRTAESASLRFEC